MTTGWPFKAMQKLAEKTPFEKHAFLRKCSKMDPKNTPNPDQIQTFFKYFWVPSSKMGPRNPLEALKVPNSRNNDQKRSSKTFKIKKNEQKRHANCGLAGQVHGHSHCNDGFIMVCTCAVKLTCCTCKACWSGGPSSQPRSLQRWVCSGLQIRREVLLHFQVPNTPRLAGAAGHLDGLIARRSGSKECCICWGVRR